MTNSIINFFQESPMWIKEAITFVISMLPIVELRGAIPVGVALGIDSWKLYILSVIGNMLPIPFVLLLARPILHFCLNCRFLKRVGTWLQSKVDKNAEKIVKYGTWGLLLFVAIPLPGTGAWTGALVAALLDLRIKKAVPSIFLGVITAGVIMLFGSNIVKFVVGLF